MQQHFYCISKISGREQAVMPLCFTRTQWHHKKQTTTNVTKFMEVFYCPVLQFPLCKSCVVDSGSTPSTLTVCVHAGVVLASVSWWPVSYKFLSSVLILRRLLNCQVQTQTSTQGCRLGVAWAGIWKIVTGLQYLHLNYMASTSVDILYKKSIFWLYLHFDIFYFMYQIF